MYLGCTRNYTTIWPTSTQRADTFQRELGLSVGTWARCVRATQPVGLHVDYTTSCQHYTRYQCTQYDNQNEGMRTRDGNQESEKSTCTGFCRRDPLTAKSKIRIYLPVEVRNREVRGRVGIALPSLWLTLSSVPSVTMPYPPQVFFSVFAYLRPSIARLIFNGHYPHSLIRLSCCSRRWAAQQAKYIRHLLGYAYAIWFDPTAQKVQVPSG